MKTEKNVATTASYGGPGRQSSIGDRTNRTIGRSLATLPAAASALCLAGTATAGTLLTFADRVSPTIVQTGDFTSGGFNFTSPAGNFVTWGTTSPYNAALPGEALVINDSDTVATIAPVVGGAFSATTVSVADTYDGVNGTEDSSIAFTGTKASGGTVTEDISVTGAPGLAAYALTGFGDITSLSEQNLSGRFLQFGDIGVGSAISAAPEPATWAMMLVGLGGLGAVMRGSRRRQAAAIA